MPWYPLSSRLWRLRIGWAELSRPKTGSFGPEQSRAWTDFYLDEQRQDRSASSAEFAAMLAKHGCPDVGNPLPNDDESHFLIHPGGFIAGEFDRVLRPAESELDQERGEQALARLGLMSHLACPMFSAKAYWAEDDLRYAMALACVEGRWELVGGRPSRVVVNALRAGLLEPQVAPGTLIARRIAEEQWHRAPWNRTETAAAHHAEDAGPPPPALEIGAWRQGRQQGQAPASETPPEQEPRPAEAMAPNSTESRA